MEEPVLGFNFMENPVPDWIADFRVIGQTLHFKGDGEVLVGIVLFHPGKNIPATPVSQDKVCYFSAVLILTSFFRRQPVSPC